MIHFGEVRFEGREISKKTFSKSVCELLCQPFSPMGDRTHANEYLDPCWTEAILRNKKIFGKGQKDPKTTPSPAKAARAFAKKEGNLEDGISSDPAAMKVDKAAAAGDAEANGAAVAAAPSNDDGAVDDGAGNGAGASAAEDQPQQKRQKVDTGDAGAGAGRPPMQRVNSNAPCAICLGPIPPEAEEKKDDEEMKDGNEEMAAGEAAGEAEAPGVPMPACGHRFHAACVLALHRMGVAHLCPPCRAAGQPLTARSSVEDAYTLHVRAARGPADAAASRVLLAAARGKLKDAVARDPGHAVARCALGHALWDQGKHREAAAELRLALQTCRATHGAAHAFTAACMQNLAAVLDEEPAHWEEAERMYRSALAIKAGAVEAGGLGDGDHPSIGVTKNNLARLLERQGRHDEAAPLYRSVLAIRRKALGDGAPKVAMTLGSLARALWGRDGAASAEAAELAARALAVAGRAQELSTPQRPHS